MPKKRKKEKKKELKKKRKKDTTTPTTSGTSDAPKGIQTDPQVTQTPLTGRAHQGTGEITQKLPPEAQQLLKQYGPLLKTIGITDMHFKIFMNLPQLMDAIATRFDVIEKHNMTGTVSANRKAAAPRPTAPGLQRSINPVATGAAAPGTGWLQGFVTSPDGQKLIASIINAFSGGGGDASSTSAAIAKEIEKGVREKALSQVRQALKVSPEFVKKVEAK